MQEIPAKQMLQRVHNGNQWFGISYNMNLYRGCCHGCIYCDSRSECYQIKNFDCVCKKENALMLLEKELQSKRKKGVVGLGSMSDTYNHFEGKEELTKGALELLNKYHFGISIETKSNLIVRDILVFNQIKKHSPVILKFSITTADDILAKKMEPNVCSSSYRFEAMQKLASENIITGVLIMPTLPYITDTKENIQNIIKKAYQNGARFVYYFGGVTLRDRQREYFFDQLDKQFSGIKQKYQKQYGNQYMCYSKDKELKNIFKNECIKYGLLYQMDDIISLYQQKEKKEEQQQVNIFDILK